MSYRLVDAVFTVALPAGPKWVLACIARYANDDGTGAWPSIETLAQLSGFGSTRTVQQHIRVLEAAGLIHTVPGGGRGATNVYTIDRLALQRSATDAQNPANFAGYPAETPQISTPNPANFAPDPIMIRPTGTGSVIVPPAPVPPTPSVPDQHPIHTAAASSTIAGDQVQSEGTAAAAGALGGALTPPFAASSDDAAARIVAAFTAAYGVAPNPAQVTALLGFTQGRDYAATVQLLCECIPEAAQASPHFKYLLTKARGWIVNGDRRIQRGIPAAHAPAAHGTAPGGRSAPGAGTGARAGGLSAAAPTDDEWAALEAHRASVRRQAGGMR